MASDADLRAFSTWLQKYGRSTGTADLYCANVAAAGAHPLRRLRSADLAPKTKRHILAALRAWAEFSKNAELLLDLKRIKLPAPARLRPRVPLLRKEWAVLLRQLKRPADDIGMTNEEQAVLVLVCARGLRVGDVLRLRKAEVDWAIKTDVLAYEGKGGRRLEFPVEGEMMLWALDTFGREEFYRWDRVAELISPNADQPQFAARRRVQRALHQLAGAAGLPAAEVYPHRLRRTYATEFLRQMKGDPEALAKLKQHMQWANLTTALEYVDHERAAELGLVARAMMDEVAAE